MASETVVRVAERDGDGAGTFQATVSFGDWAEYEVTVTDPAGPEGEELLGWYFEEHLRYPFLDKDLEEAAVGRIAEYGQALFGQVFGGEASHDYRTLRGRAFDGCRLEVGGSAAFHRLHWEALRDPDVPAPLAVRLPVTRRVSGLGSKFELPAERATLNILVVTARPDGPKDVGYRTISRPLLATLRRAGLPVQVDLVRPGTWRALREHLQAATARHGSGYYQVAHFDVHGAFSDYPALEDARQADQLMFSPGLAPFEGSRGFVFFETAQAGKAGPVAAEEVAALLAEHRVPVAVLNACQSAMQDASEAGLAQRLAEAGVPVAVGMAYSVTVSAAERAMPVLYRQIADGVELTGAVHAARRELFEHKERRAYFRQQLELEDWMLPVMFAQQPLHLQLQPMTGVEQTGFYERRAAVGDEPSTEYGFVGRDLDIQAIEHAVLAGPDGNELLIQGMAGAGKTTLLAHLAWWWQRTGLIGEVFRFSYEDRAWTAGQIVREIRARLLPPGEHALADTMSEAAQIEQVAELLRAARNLLILDNTESITAAPAAIPHTLSPAEREKIKTLLGRLHGGRTLVLLGSRERETWLTAESSGPGIYPLPGLDEQAASVLVEKILARHDASHYLTDPAERSALTDLVKLLGGYPLPLTVVLPVLASLKPSAVLTELKEGGAGADPAGLIVRAIEYSHGKLDPALQASLQLLAPFTAVIPTGPFLEAYWDQLRHEEAIQELGPVDLTAALDQAAAVGLAAPHSELGHLVQVQPVLPYFLRTRLHTQPPLQAITSQGHYELYCGIGQALQAMLTSLGDPQQRMTGLAAARAEYANLTTALDFALQAGLPITGLIGALDEYLDQAQQHDTRRQLLEHAIAAYRDPATEDQQRDLIQLHDLAGHTALTQHRHGDAHTHYESVLQLQQATGDRRGQAVTYHQLGAVAQEQRRFPEAEAEYRKALDISLAFGDRHGVASAYHQLGRVAQELRRFAEAEAAFRKALEIKLELGDRRSAANAYHQLGSVAQEQRRFADAEAAYRKALEIKLEFGDQHAAALTYHQLGRVAQEQRQLAQAEAAYRKALEIKLEFGDQHGAASTYHQLGTVAQTQGRFAEAEAAYRKALEIKLEFGDQHAAAFTYHQLGTVAQTQGRFAEAEAAYRKALEIKLEFGDQYSAASTYHNLGMVAQEQRRFAEAEAAYRQALSIYQETDRRSVFSTAASLGTVLAMLGQHLDATRTLLYSVVVQQEETGQWARYGLQWLHRERALLEPDQFAALMQAEVPAGLAEDLTVAIDKAEDPPEDDPPPA